jgi:membrane fusion protein, multidrug efflux system
VLAHQAGEIRAEIRRQEMDIADRTIVSPADGKVVMTFVRKGEHVAPGQRIAMFHDPEQIWVEANVKETDVGVLKPGMKADIRVDAFPGKVYKGEVYRIGHAATSKFALLPDPNPSGNFTKITQRLPVRIKLTDKDPALRPGMMVEVDIDARDH